VVVRWGGWGGGGGTRRKAMVVLVWGLHELLMFILQLVHVQYSKTVFYSLVLLLDEHRLVVSIVWLIYIERLYL